MFDIDMDSPPGTPDTASRTLTSIEIESLLAPLRETILDKPRYISGAFRLPSSCFSLFYRTTKDSHAARCINLANATFDELQQLAQTCEPASLGVVQEGVTNEVYYKVGKMDFEGFAPSLELDQTNLEELIRNYIFGGFKSRDNKIRIELHELNVYTKGSFTKPRIEMPRGENMLGSLVIVFPTPHEGGSLLVRDEDQEWSFDPGRELTTARAPTIGYAALFNDVEHEVAPVTSGYRVTLTYDLRLDVDGPTSMKDQALAPFSLPVYERTFQETLEALLKNPEFLAYGGMLGFGLSHVYPAGRGIGHVYDLLKASDAVIYRSFRELGFQPALYMYYEWQTYWADSVKGALIDHRVDFGNYADEFEDFDLSRAVLAEDGILVYRGEAYRADGDERERPVKVDWVTPVTTFNRQESAHISYGNEPTLEMTYWDLCLVVRIGKVGERLMYSTVAQSRKESHQR